MKKMMLVLLVAMLLLTACSENEIPQTTASTSETVPGDSAVEPTEPSTVVTTPAPTRPPVEVPEVEEVPVEENTPFDYDACTELFGAWELTVTITSAYANAPDFTGSASFPATFTFTDDGRYTVTLQRDSFEAAIHGYENALADFMIEGYYNKFVAEKKISALTDQQIQQRWEESGLANAQNQAHSFLDSMTLGYNFGKLVRSGYYYAEDGVLYLSVGDDYESFQYTIDEEGLILSKSSRIRYYSQLCIYFPTALKPRG